MSDPHVPYDGDISVIYSPKAASIPADNWTAGEKTDIQNRVTALEGSAATAINDLSDVNTATSPPSVGDLLWWNGANWVPYTPQPINVTTGMSFIIDGGGSTITTGIKGDIKIPFYCTINPVYMLADQVGRIYVDVWKDTYANYPPTSADQIHQWILYDKASIHDTTALAVNAGDVLRLNVSSVTSITRLSLALTLTRSVGP